MCCARTAALQGESEKHMWKPCWVSCSNKRIVFENRVPNCSQSWPKPASEGPQTLQNRAWGHPSAPRCDQEPSKSTQEAPKRRPGVSPYIGSAEEQDLGVPALVPLFPLFFPSFFTLPFSLSFFIPFFFCLSFFFSFSSPFPPFFLSFFCLFSLFLPSFFWS